MLSITDDPMKIITLQLMETLPNVEKVLILGGRAWNFFGDMIPELVSQAGPITHPRIGSWEESMKTSRREL